MRRAIFALAAAAVLTVGVGVAAGRSAETTITHDGTVALDGGESLVSGHVESSRHACEFLRVVKFSAHYPGGKVTLLDIGLTSFNGAWAAKADLSGANRLTATTPAVRGKKRRHHRHRKVICRRASVSWDVL
jgi:hypothetical protein